MTGAASGAGGEPTTPAPGDPAPDFTADTDAGERLTLTAFRGRPVVLYFFPRADTETCTAQACAFRDAVPRFGGAGAAVIGVSPDTVRALARFKAKYALPFTLVADADHRVAEAYGVWREKSMYGRTFFGVERTTFVLDRAGRVAQVFPRVRVKGHAEAVAAVLARLG